MTAGTGTARERPLDDVSAVVVGPSLVGGLVGELFRQQGARVDFVATTAVGDNTATGVAWRPLDGDAAALDLDGVDVVFDTTADGVLTPDDDRKVVRVRIRPFPREAASPHRECLDWVVAAELGLYRVGNAERPSIELLPVSSTYAAIQAATYACAALFHDRGGDVEVSMFGAGVLAADSELQSLATTFADSRATYHADVNSSHGFGLSGRFRCADGRYLQPHGRSPGVTSATLRALGHPEWVDDAVDSILGGDTVTKAEWSERFTAAFAGHPSAELERAIATEGGAGAVCRDRDEWRAEAHALDAEIFVASTGPGPSRRVGPAVRLFGRSDPVEPSWRPAAAPDPSAGPLAGLRVLDLSIVLAGPTCGRLLSELGADVIKVDAPERAVYPYRSPYGWLDVNRGKRSILLDLKTAEGKAVLWKLIEDADVLLENYRAGKIERLGFGPDAVAAVRPALTYVSLNAFDFGGDFTPRPGWEPNAQAMCGMQVAAADGPKPVRLSLAPNDYGTGLLGAFGVVMALRRLLRTGSAQHVRGSLARTATLLQREYFDGSPDGRAAAHPGPALRFTACDDGWIVSPATAGLPEHEAGTADELIARWRHRGVVTARVRGTDDVRDLDWARRAGSVVAWPHPHWGAMTNAVARGRSTLFRHDQRWPAPDPGENSDEILRELGYRDRDIDHLLRDGVVHGRVPLFPVASEETS
jgi:crotonobetainyl-CoA:carnitine CoA-transferase CaiB-like acyl-CoA transferase